jgi:hypothetical protein
MQSAATFLLVDAHGDVALGFGDDDVAIGIDDEGVFAVACGSAVADDEVGGFGDGGVLGTEEDAVAVAIVACDVVFSENERVVFCVYVVAPVGEGVSSECLVIVATYNG